MISKNWGEPADIAKVLRDMKEQMLQETGLEPTVCCLPLWLHHEMLSAYGPRYGEKHGIQIFTAHCECDLCKADNPHRTI